jgi:DNA-binding LacI/PurR family transcriptional regulator
MAERPTLDTVAREAGVSRMTVSNAYNRPDQLSAATRERVLAAAARLGYPGPDPAGRSLRRRQVGAVGVLLTDRLPTAFTDPGLVSFLRGIADELGAASQAMLLVPAEADVDGSLVRNAIVDAFIVCSVDPEHPAAAAARSRRQPLVTAGHTRITGVPYVGVDNRRAGALAAQHLLDLGHRRFGVVSVPTRFGMLERARSFVRALHAAGIAEDAVTLVDASATTPADGARAARELLDVPATRRPTAVFAVTDVLALATLGVADELGLRVPRDMSVLGFDDVAEAAHASPPLTTLSQSLHEQGREAARLALALVGGQPVRQPRFAAELVVRGSTGPPPRRQPPGPYGVPPRQSATRSVRRTRSSPRPS